MNYRAEIDGLRAVAVFPVILFHAGLSLFSGGFVGVDIFFVISGYLITTIIINNIDAGRFSLAYFYERRARRILPALYIVMVASIPFAWAWLKPSDMKDFAESLLAVSTFWSNILFLNESGYFDTAAELKPLLHTWSLAVEEQYYIIFPLLLMGFWKLGKRRLLYILSAVFLVSLASAHWYAYRKPSEAFYLLPMRGWELLIGAMVAFYLQRRPHPFSPFWKNILSLLGLMLILFSIFFYDDSTPFPSLYALVPTLGTALIILCADAGTLVKRLLSMRLLVGIGLVSYSAYLWHQPMMAYARHLEILESNTLVIAVIIVTTFLLAYVTWRFVEKPFRQPHRISRSALVKTSLAAFAALIVFAGVGIKTEGFTFRYSADDLILIGDIKKHQKHAFVKTFERRHKQFDTDGLKVLIVGDSNSADLLNALFSAYHQDNIQFRSMMIGSGCGNLFLSVSQFRDHIDPALAPNCKNSDRYDLPLSETLLREADIVFVASAWYGWEVELLPASIQALTEKYGNKFLVFGVKHFTFDQQAILDINVPQRYALKVQPVEKMQELNNRMADGITAPFINPYDYLCDTDGCPIFDKNHNLIVFDGFHLTKSGAEYLGKRFLEENLLDNVRRQLKTAPHPDQKQ